MQTYRPSELLIVSENGADRESIPPDVRFLELDRVCTVGEKRNAGCEAARGELIAHWDDDDYSAPGRLADQVQRLLETGKSVTGYRAMQFTNGHEWWQYRCANPLYAIGTSLLYRRDWWRSHKFKPQNVGEDECFVAEARAHGDIVSGDAGDLMFATIHNGNTSPRPLTGSNWRKL